MRRAAAAAVTVLLLWAIAGCSDSADDGASTPGANPDPTTTTANDGPAESRTTTGEPTPPPPLDWTPCEGEGVGEGMVECAQMEVPLDHDDAAGRTITLGMVRRSASDTDRRVGSLLVNPGGPGGSATRMVRYGHFPEELTRRFDIVGVDPRGVGISTPLTCNTHLQALYDADPTIDEPADRDLLIDTSMDLIGECEAAHGYLLPHLGSRAVARDLDLVRAALGDEKLTYLGYSYGTVIGQVYAQLHPDRVRALVLDGAVPLDQTGLDGAAGQAAGFSRAIDAFIARCDDQGCGLGAPARDVIEDVMAAAEQNPIPVEEADRPATPGVVNLALARALYHESLWPRLADALDDALDGNGDGLVRLADSYLNRRPDGSYEQGFETYFAVNCLDWAWPDDPDDLLAEGAALEEEYPLFGEALVNDYVRCPLWPTPSDPLDPLDADRSEMAELPPTLVISTTGDPATPYQSGVDVAADLPGGILITNVGEGHTIFGNGKQCIDEPVVAYLVDLEVPATGLRC